MDCCSLCGKPRNEVKRLVKLGSGHICNRCADSARDSLVEEEKKKDSKNEKPLLKPKEIKAYLDQYVIAQERAKEIISTAVYNHYKRRDIVKRGVDLGVELQKSNILILGPTGTGKTQIARSIARSLNVPFYAADATKLTQAGYVGDDVESLLQGLIADCDGDTNRAQWGIIFLDEIDKLARKSGRSSTGHRDVTGEGVQQALLKMIEGSKIHVPRGMGVRAGMTEHYDMFDTSNVLFICAGSFAGIEEIVKRRVNKGTKVGFGASARKDLSETEIYSQFVEEDVLDFGLIPELLGRIPVHTSTLPLTEDEMVRVLTEPKDAIVRQYQALFSLDGIRLEFDEGALRAIGREAKSRPTGARALRSIVERITQNYAYECPSDPEVRAIRINREVVEEGAPAIVERAPAASPPSTAVA